jgi:hypothetical protein
MGGACFLALHLVDEIIGRSRDELLAVLAEKGIETRPFFLSLHHLPPFREASRKREEQLPVRIFEQRNEPADIQRLGRVPRTDCNGYTQRL